MYIKEPMYQISTFLESGLTPGFSRASLKSLGGCWQCNTNIFDYSNIQILGGKYFLFKYEYLFSSVRIYLIFVFGPIDLTNIYSLHIRYEFAGYSAYIRYIFEYQPTNIHYLNINVLFYWNKYIWYLYSVKSML